MRSVVVAEDDPEVRGMLREYLGGCGFEVLEAGNGLELLLQVKRARPAAVVLDIHMPRLDGVEAIKRLRAFDPAIVIVVVTGDEDVALHRRVVELGAAVVFTKPVPLERLAAALTPGDAPPTAAPIAAERMVVLVIDDDDGVCRLLADFLQPLGYDVETAADAAAGLRRLARAPVDLVLLDVQLPGLNGIAALPSLRVLAPEAGIVIISGTADDALAALATAHGAFAYVTKPLDLPRLAKTMETAVAVRRGRA